MHSGGGGGGEGQEGEVEEESLMSHQSFGVVHTILP